MSAQTVEDMGYKLKTGVKQVLTAPFELPKETSYYSSRENNKILGTVGGILEGAMKATHKGISGIINILTFPFTNYDC